MLVLTGNLSTAKMLHGLGASSSGWSKVGTSLADSLHQDLDPAMETVGTALTGSISALTEIEQGVDVMLSLSGSATDRAMTNISGTKTLNQMMQIKDQMMVQLRSVSANLVRRVSVQIDRLMELLTPALNQVKEWLSTFGEKIQTALEEFGTTMDRVQKVFDSVMQQASTTAGSGEELMLYNTYTLFDTDKSGSLRADDIQSVADLYGISALAGNKASELFEKYDSDGKGGIDEDEYSLFVHDPTIPGIMALMLRTYSQKLATIAGTVGGAKMRDEAARAVGEYLSLVCAKNMSKLAWVSDTLSNGTLPVEFTADVLKGLSLSKDNPNDLTLVEVGLLVTREMVRLSAARLTEAMELLADPAFWESEGFDPKIHPKVVRTVVRWASETRDGANAVREALDLQGVATSSLVTEAEALVKSRSQRYWSQQSSEKASGDESLYSANASKALRSALLGGVGAAAKGETKEVSMAVNGGQRAMPETLLFLSWLAANASDTANRHFEECFDYAGTSSGSLDSLASGVSGLIKKVQGFIGTMETYATPKGIDMLTGEAKTFANHATDDILLVVEQHVDAQFASWQCEVDSSKCVATGDQLDMALDLSGAFTFISKTLVELKQVMPTVIDDLKFARKEVSAVSKTIRTVMEVMGLKAPPMFYTISKLYKVMWVLYFTFFGLLTICVLFYGFWASGFFGGPGPSAADESYEAPRTFGDKMRTVCCCCCQCMKGCSSTALCFWSLIMIFELVVLVLFVVAVVICIIGGVQAFMAAGCSQVYILGDDAVCTSAMTIMKGFLNSFGVGSKGVEDMCGQEALLTCKMISDEVVTAVKISVVGGLLSSVLSFQMIVESSIMHERARWRLMMDVEAKKPV
eukprot:CAMPEP_0195054498 /NCGR_PEP_ID=MMETSP0448-20130528/3432_1 /TAXON_ID=66468 /ORGANISM="Heterocapsa triquestra, Strain CCMP 448" /LENGTH=864 /DNA_ID=CAMNT_0040084021 /DNA_START=202 /DNA_END=2796 /DNA_ORIENTATION=-